jgi:hypothetical protein
MKLALSVGAFFLLLSLQGFAESWTGVLVDSKCFDSAEANVNPWEPYRDQAMDVRYCRPKARTKSFAIIQADWSRLKLDSGVNAKAADLVGKAGKTPYIGVVVTGEKTKDTVTVESISIAKSKPAKN